MSPLLSNILSTLLFLLGVHFDTTETASFSVIQTPSSLNVVEGTTLSMECQINVSEKVWFIEWHVNKTGENMKLSNTSSVYIYKDPKARWSNLTLKRADIADSGIYVCNVGDSTNSHISSKGTQVTINELTNLMVTQTPEHSEEKEGATVTIECSFRTVSNYSTMYVRWYKDGQNLTSERDSLTLIQDLEKGFASLTLKNTKEVDSGLYVCEVGSGSRNLSGSGAPSHIVITGSEKKTSVLDNTVNGAGVGAGVGAGAVLLALLIGIFVWRRKQSSNGTPLTTSELESVSTKNVRTQHPLLASQASDVTYADLSFNKRDVKPDAEVVYAEVKVGRKQMKEP